MANPQTPATSTTTNPASTDATRGDGPDMLTRTRAKFPIVDHAAQLAAQARVEEAERKLAATQAQVAALEAAASKAATVEGAQRHDLAMVERKHSLEMAREHQRWALADATRERDRQLVEADRARNALISERHIADVQRQCEATANEVANLHRACAQERNRINTGSVAVGALVGAIGTGLARSKSSGETGKKTHQKTRSNEGTALAALGGTVSAAAPFVLPLLRSSSNVPTPLTASGLDAYHLALVAERDRLHAELAVLRATVFSPASCIAGLVGGGAITYAVIG